MKILLILLIFVLQLHSIELKNLNAIEAIYGLNNGTIQGQEIDNSKKHFISVTTYNDIIFNKYFTVTSTLNYTNHDDYYSRSYNIKISKDDYFELSELVFNIYLTPNDVLSTGIFSFKNGAFSEHSRIGLKQSDALMTLYYINMTGAFYTHHFDNNNKVQIGYAGRFNNIYIMPEDRYEHSRDGSDILYLFTSHNIDKHTIKFNLSTSNIVYEKIGDSSTLSSIGQLSIAGLGYQYDDRDDSGILYYTIAGISQTNFDSTGISPTGESYSRGKEFNFDKEDTKYGYSLLLGTKKDYDANLFGMDTYVGLEYFYASKSWVSYTTDSATVGYYSWGHLGHNFKAYTGVNISPKIKLGVTTQAQKITDSKIPGGNESYQINDTQFQYCIRLDLLF